MECFLLLKCLLVLLHFIHGFIGDTQMLKKWTLGILLLTTSLFSQATLITSDVYSVDMEGISVTAYFSDTSQETLIWSAITATTGGVQGSVWSLMLDGLTFGDYDPISGEIYGLWTLTNEKSPQKIVGLTIDAGIKGFYFDVVNGTTSSTPGSEAGREFAANDDTVTVAYGDSFSAPDLFGTLSIAWGVDQGLSAGEQLLFLTDTDKAEVPEPSILFTFALGLLALTSFRKKSSGK